MRWEHARTSSMLAHNNGYYVGTMKGLYFFSGNSDGIAIKKPIPELEDQLIRFLFKDNNNALWIASETKLHQYIPKTKHLKTYGYSENIRGGFFNNNSYIKKRNGQVFLGTVNGVHYFHPEKIDIHPKQLHPYIRKVTIRQLKDSITNVEDPMRLTRHQNTINIRFSTPYYGNPDDITYKYQLTENGEWFNHGNQPGLTLWKLPPGEYQFRAAATISGDTWHSTEEVFRFTILPPFWQTWWFSLLMSLSGITIIFNIVTSFKKKLKIEKILNAFATSLYGHTTVNDILWNTARYCIQKLDFTDCAIYELDKKKNVLLQKAVVTSKDPYNREDPGLTEIPVNTDVKGTVIRSGKSRHIRNAAGSKITSSEIAVPIWIEEEIFGVITSQHSKRDFYKHYHLRLLEKIAALCSERIRKYLTEEKLRGKIARDLHDEMGSTLTSIHIISKMTEQDLQENTPAKKQLARIKSHTSGMMEKMSDMVWVVNPANDALDKLMQRIKEYAIEVLEPHDINLSFEEEQQAEHIKLNPEQRKNCYLIAKEALNNIVKYSKASKVGIIFKEENKLLKMRILDNGKGYSPSDSSKGNGVKNMHIRAEEMKAALHIKTSPGKGVSLILSVAVEKYGLPEMYKYKVP